MSAIDYRQRHPRSEEAVCRLRRRPLLALFAPGFTATVSVDVDPVAGVADTGRFADDLAMLFEVVGETSRDLGIGTLILVDELQEASPGDLTAVNTAVHQMGQSDIPLPITFVGAGDLRRGHRHGQATSL